MHQSKCSTWNTTKKGIENMKKSKLPPVEPGQGGAPYYQKLGALDAQDPTRKRKRAVPHNFKLAYLVGWCSVRLPESVLNSL